jgi:hypothetical protein
MEQFVLLSLACGLLCLVLRDFNGRRNRWENDDTPSLS